MKGRSNNLNPGWAKKFCRLAFAWQNEVRETRSVGEGADRTAGGAPALQKQNRRGWAAGRMNLNR